jgi:hypothetical protein
MTQRQRLANRRAAETFGFECSGLHYTASISRFFDGSLAEIFIGSAKAGSHSDAAAKDSAVVCSIALQYGVPVETIRHALLRDWRAVHAARSAPSSERENSGRAAAQDFESSEEGGDNPPAAASAILNRSNAASGRDAGRACSTRSSTLRRGP